MACKNCREKRTRYVLPTLPPTPPTLAALNALERRLLAMAKVNQVLIDKLPAGGPSAQWGRMYMSPLDEPRLCNLLEGAELGQDGEVYVEGVQGMLASTARLQHLFAALQTLRCSTPPTRTARLWTRPWPTLPASWNKRLQHSGMNLRKKLQEKTPKRRSWR